MKKEVGKMRWRRALCVLKEHSRKRMDAVVLFFKFRICLWSDKNARSRFAVFGCVGRRGGLSGSVCRRVREGRVRGVRVVTIETAGLYI